MTKNIHSTGRISKWHLGILLYVLLIIVSNIYSAQLYDTRRAQQPSDDSSFTQIEMRDDDGFVIEHKKLWIHYEEFIGINETDARVPVLMMHGAPGSGDGFVELGQIVAKTGRRVYAPDLIGFSKSDLAPNISYRVQARYMFSFLDEMGVDKVHLVGWSNGGGVGLRMADLDPDRIASLTMLASVGAQETEGSGSYSFEHLKYAVGLGAVGYLPDLLPHFGMLGTRDMRSGWLWSFWDSDQRELTEIMPTITTPVMILHGRDDPLVPSWGAELHHEIMPTSKLVMLDASHFLPFMQAEESAGYLNAFFDRHDQPGVAPETEYLNLAPVPERTGFDRMLHLLGDWIIGVPWWVDLIFIIVLVRKFTTVGIAITILFATMMSVDFGVAILGMLVGRTWWLIRGAHGIDRPFTLWGWARGMGYVLPAYIAGTIGSAWTLSLTQRLGTIGFVVGFVLLLGLLAGMRLIVTWEGRQRIKGEINRITNHEYWVTGLVYLPMLWWGIKRMAARKWLIELTSVNPGYAHDGGIMCESKMDINQKLGDGQVSDDALLHCVLIESSEDTQSRIDKAIDAITNDTQLGGYPVFCKPDQGERGRAVCMVENESELKFYCQENDESFVIQQRHRGEMEVGVLWVRHVDSITNVDHTGPSGFIYAITIKHFPVVIGDGKRSIRRLILGHSRYRAQSRMFFEHMRSQLHTVPSNGQEVALGIAGNHAQGAMFTDGKHLITDALSNRIGEIVERFVDDAGNGFDIGRFDLRCDSLEQLAQGKGFGIVELNGLTSEPTNLYDPKESIFWAWNMLCGYWLHAEKIAEARLDNKSGKMVDKETWKKIRGALVRVMFT